MASDTKEKISIEQINNPPVVEAIIEMTFSPEEKTSFSLLEEVAKEFKKDFPIEKKVFIKGPSVSGQKTPPKEAAGAIGLNLRSSEKETFKNIQLRPDKILVSNVGQYCGGSELIKTFESVWKPYVHHMKFKQCTRLGMRYINKVIIGIDELVEKIEVLPNLPEVKRGLYLNELMFNFTVADDKLENKANINYFFSPAGDNGDKPEKLGIFVDIDAYQEDIDIQKWDVVFNKLKDIRDFKNDFFLGSFTQKGLRDFIK